MRRLSIAFLLVLTSAALGADPTLKERTEAVAAALPWYDANAAVLGNTPDWGPAPEKIFDAVSRLQPGAPDGQADRGGRGEGRGAEGRAGRGGRGDRGRGGVDAPKWSPDDIRPLLSHADPRVRTLGLLLLNDLQRLDVLPDVALLIKDEAETFPTPAHLSNAVPNWPMEKTTVASYAGRILQRYAWSDELAKDGRLSGEPAELAKRLREFAAKRDSALSTISLRNALWSDLMGWPREPLDRSHYFALLARVPAERRFFVALVWRQAQGRREDGMGEPLVPDDYLLTLAREVPREVRLAAIANKRTPINDPDLPPGFGAQYILEHAADLLTPQDVPRLLELEKQQAQELSQGIEWDARRSDYALAAAKLQPEKADEILLGALSGISGNGSRDERTALAILLARVGTDRGQSEAIHWFFREPPQRGANGFGRAMFLSKLHQQDPIRFRKIIERIIRDDRLTTLGPASTRLLMIATSGYLGRALADAEQMRAASGFDETQWDAKFLPLSEWHKTLKNTVDEWAK